MRIYYKLLGGHYHCRVFINGAKSGDLCCRESEWTQFMLSFDVRVQWIEEE